jgi:nicotinamidase-related amidase
VSPPSADGGGAWLVVIDMQEIFAQRSSPWGTPGFTRASAGIQRLLPEFEERTVFTRFVAPATPTGAWISYYEQWPFALVPDADPLYGLAAPFAELATRVETRDTFGKWDARLADATDGASEIVLAGVSTDCCVISTALVAADAGVRVRVVGDACAGLSGRDHRRALATMALYAPLIEITTIDEVLAGS